MYLIFCSASSEKCECIGPFAPRPSLLCECIAVRAMRRPGLRYIRTAPSLPCECIAVRAPRSSKTGHFLYTHLQEVARKLFKIVVRLISATAPPLKKQYSDMVPCEKTRSRRTCEGLPPKVGPKWQLLVMVSSWNRSLWEGGGSHAKMCECI